MSELERLGIGADRKTKLRVIKANKIIPKCIAVVRAEGSYEIPSACPVCGAATEVRVSPVSGVKTLRCTDANCPAKHLKRFVRFASKAGLDIDGLSVQTLHEFVNRGYLRDFSDLYHLNDHAGEIVALEGFGEKSWRQPEGRPSKKAAKLILSTSSLRSAFRTSAQMRAKSSLWHSARRASLRVSRAARALRM